MTRTVSLGLALLLAAACGGQPAPKPGIVGNTAGSDDPPAGVVKDTRTPIERRRDAACEKLGPKLAQCAVEDSREKLAAGQITQQQFADATKPDVVRALAADWRKNCRKGYMSSRQVRVLEVCFREEPECGPLEACLQNLEATK
jgi:hypothetical protein